MRKSTDRLNTLVFVDTNIFFDFYRIARPGRKLLDNIVQHKARVITTCQVEMEYLKNRQRVIRQFASGLDPSKPKSVGFPAFIEDRAAAKSLAGSVQESINSYKSLRDDIRKTIESPATEDGVYQVLCRLFHADWPYHLRQDGPEFHRIRRLAWKRFVLGYPPRKDRDTSIGDAINWEWMVACALRGNDIIIVSGDEDYGPRVDKEMIINDYLAQEFRNRIGREHNVTLTNSLSKALEMIKVPVSEQAKAAETALIEDQQRAYSFRSARMNTMLQEAVEELQSHDPAELLNVAGMSMNNLMSSSLIRALEAAQKQADSFLEAANKTPDSFERLEEAFRAYQARYEAISKLFETLGQNSKKNW